MTTAPTIPGDAGPAIALDVADIQAGALSERPSPYVGRYLLLRVDDPATAGSWSAGWPPWPPSAPTRRRSAADAWTTVAFTYRGLEKLGVPAGLPGRLRAGVPRGDGGPRRRTRRRRGERPRALGGAARLTGRARGDLGAGSGRGAAGRGRRAGAGRLRRSRRRRGDLAPGLLPAAVGPHLLRVQGRHRSARRRGQRPPPSQPHRGADQGRRVRARLPRRDRVAAADAEPRRARPQRHVPGLPQAAHPRRRLPSASCASGPPTGPRRSCSAPRWSAAGRAGPRSRWRRTATTPGSAPTRPATTPSATATTVAA